MLNPVIVYVPHDMHWYQTSDERYLIINYVHAIVAAVVHTIPVSPIWHSSQTNSKILASWSEHKKGKEFVFTRTISK